MESFISISEKSISGEHQWRWQVSAKEPENFQASSRTMAMLKKQSVLKVSGVYSTVHGTCMYGFKCFD